MRLSDKNYTGPLKAVIFDWAGTTVDYGCFAPTGVFVEVFRQKGIDITLEEARGPMGMHKRDHIRKITQYTRVAAEWLLRTGREFSEADIEKMFKNFIPLQLEIIGKYSEIIPELPDALKVIRSMGMKIGSTTGYNNEMMAIVTAAAAKQGYVADSVVCASDVPAGRPAPWMAFKNAENLGIYPMQAIVKIGDTIADIEEGLNAGMWSVGVILSSNEMGMTLSEVISMDHLTLELRKRAIREKYLNAGAHFVIESLAETGTLLAEINARLAKGLLPGQHCD
jgi:phosphonoacetaldehyde hydrolase